MSSPTHGLSRRLCLLGVVAALTGGRTTEALAQSVVTRRPLPDRPTPPPRRVPPRLAPSRRANAPAGPQPSANWAPPVDGPPPPSRNPRLDAAPVPLTNPRPAAGDGTPRPSLDFGVSTPPVFGQGDSFRSVDPSPTQRQPEGFRLPSPGATIRVPF